MDIPKFNNKYVVLEEDKCLDYEHDPYVLHLFLDLLMHRIANGDMSSVDTYNICSYGFGLYDSSADDGPRSVVLAKERAAINHELEIIEFVKTMDKEACKAEIEELAKNYKGENLEKRLEEILHGYI